MRYNIVLLLLPICMLVILLILEFIDVSAVYIALTGLYVIAFVGVAVGGADVLAPIRGVGRAHELNSLTWKTWFGRFAIAVCVVWSAINQSAAILTAKSFGDPGGPLQLLLDSHASVNTYSFTSASGEKCIINMLDVRSANELVAHGEYGSEYADGAVRCELNYFMGLAHGTVSLWYQNGNCAVRGQYSRGLPSGQWEFWHENGVKAAQGEQEARESWKYWDSAGSPIAPDERQLIRIVSFFPVEILPIFPENNLEISAVTPPLWKLQESTSAMKRWGVSVRIRKSIGQSKAQ